MALEVIGHDSAQCSRSAMMDPVFPIAERARAFERFYRIPDRPSAAASGSRSSEGS